MTTQNFPVCPVTGKTQYPDAHEATQAVRSLKQHKHSEKAYKYTCEHCGEWHITSGRQKTEYSRRKKRKKQKGLEKTWLM